MTRQTSNARSAAKNDRIMDTRPQAMELGRAAQIATRKTVHTVLCTTFVVAALSGFAPLAAAIPVDLTVTASWTATNFDVSSTGPNAPLGISEENDDKVFGIAPSAGSTSFVLRVETDSAVSYASGYNGITHDWFGYSEVELLGTHTLGTASWTTVDILTNLVGVDGLTRALWTDADITAANPTRLSVRMFGDWDGSTADLFVGPRTTTTIGTQFLAWEYFGGEEIRTNNYTVISSAAAVPEPTTIALIGVGLLGCMAYRRQRQTARRSVR